MGSKFVGVDVGRVLVPLGVVFLALVDGLEPDAETRRDEYGGSAVPGVLEGQRIGFDAGVVKVLTGAALLSSNSEYRGRRSAVL